MKKNKNLIILILLLNIALGIITGIVKSYYNIESLWKPQVFDLIIVIFNVAIAVSHSMGERKGSK